MRTVGFLAFKRNNDYCFLSIDGDVFYQRNSYQNAVETTIMYNINNDEGMKKFIDDLVQFGKEERSREIRNTLKNIIGI